MNAAEITDKLGLHSLRQRHWWIIWALSLLYFFIHDLSSILNMFLCIHRYIQSTCATSGEGLYEGLDWLSNNIANKASTVCGLLVLAQCSLNGCMASLNCSLIYILPLLFHLNAGVKWFWAILMGWSWMQVAFYLVFSCCVVVLDFSFKSFYYFFKWLLQYLVLCNCKWVSRFEYNAIKSISQ